MREPIQHADHGNTAERAYRRVKFNDRTIHSLKPNGKHADFWDESLRGFGIRVAPSGRKTWIVMYRRPNGSASRLKIGTYPAVGLADARLKAKTYLGQVEIEGRDPAAERQAERNAETFGQLAEVYLRRWAKQVDADGTPRKKSWREDERQIRKYLLPAWSNHRVKDITRRDVRELVEGVAERRLRKGTTENGDAKTGAPIMANRLLSLIKKMFNFALDREWIDANPAARLKPVATERVRDRVLSADEIRTFWSALDSLHYRSRTMFRLMLLTGQRSGEIARMRWPDVRPTLNEREGDGPGVLLRAAEPAVWTIPASVTKNKRAHEVPLSVSAIRVLQELAETEERERQKVNELFRAKKGQPPREASEWIFPSRNCAGPTLEVQKAVQLLRKRCGFRFTAHDLRRTAATMMGELGVSESIIAKILNHTEGGITRRVYNRHGYRAEKRDALEQWSRHLHGIVATETPATGSNVVNFHR